MALRDLSSGSLKVRRTENGVLAVLRIQGVGDIVAGCGYDEAHALGAEVGLWPDTMEVGFSFAGLARSIGRAATSIAKSRLLGKLAGLAKMLPSPIGDVARMAGQAAKVIKGISAGDPSALAAWGQSAIAARAAPNSPRAVAMRLAMDAVGRPRLGRPPVPPPVVRAPAPEHDGGAELADYSGAD